MSRLAWLLASVVLGGCGGDASGIIMAATLATVTVGTFVSWPLTVLGAEIGLWIVYAIERWDARVDERRRQGPCVTSGYNLTGNVSGVCPECGTPIEGTDKSGGETTTSATRP